MKRLLLSILLLKVAVACFSQSQYEKFKQAAIDKGYQIISEKYADLAQGETAYSTMQFYSGYNYIIIGLSDDSDVDDVDLFVNYTDGTDGLEDGKESPIAYLDFRMTNCNFREMNVVIKNCKSKTPSNSSKCRFFVAASKITSYSSRSRGNSGSKKSVARRGQKTKRPLIIPNF